MTRKELLEKIKREMPEGLNEKETIAFIMWKIAENRSFSEHYYWGDSATSNKMYSRAMEPKNVALENKRKLICVTASKLFKYIATELGMEVFYVGEEGIPIEDLTKWSVNKGEHVYPAVELSDGSLIKCDLQQDLANIQTGCRWKYFGSAYVGEKDMLSEISREELDEIMRKIGFLNNRDMYTDDYCRKKESELSEDMTVTEIVQSVFEDERLNEENSHTSIIETYRFYMKIMGIYLSKGSEEYDIYRCTQQLTRYVNSFYMFPCKMKRDGHTRYTLCAYTVEEEGNGNIYLLSRTTRRMLPITLEELSSFQKQGLIIPNPGTKHLRKRLNLLTKNKEVPRKISERDLEEFVDESADERW